MTMNNLVQMYKRGAITAHHLIVECLQMIDPASPDPILSALPPEVFGQLVQFVAQYRADQMVTNYGGIPTEDQVMAAADWIQRAHPNLSGGLPITHR